MKMKMKMKSIVGHDTRVGGVVTVTGLFVRIVCNQKIRVSS